MIKENKASKYLLYAIGEIVLVVIGILIALQINNTNELEKQRSKELHYLENIKTDLYVNIDGLNSFITTRTKAIASANIVLEHFEGKPLTDLSAFSEHTFNIYTSRMFFQNNNTFQELLNSGNLALISNHAIKTILLNMELLSKKMKYEEEHFRFDAEISLYAPAYKMIDFNPSVKNYSHRVTDGRLGVDVKLEKEQYEIMLKDMNQKNGFVMAVLEFNIMNSQFEQMKMMCQKLIVLIDQELRKA
jgi:hypothetical protein